MKRRIVLAISLLLLVLGVAAFQGNPYLSQTGYILTNATSGSITLAAVAGALGTRTASFPAATGTVSLTVDSPCATAGATCTETVTAGVKRIYGTSGALNAASPSVATVTFSTGFTGTTTYNCTANNVGTTAAIAAAGVAFSPTSATVATFTSANGASNTVSFTCQGT